MSDKGKKAEEAQEAKSPEIPDQLFEETLRSLKKIEGEAARKSGEKKKVYEIDLDEAEGIEDLNLMMKILELEEKEGKDSGESKTSEPPESEESRPEDREDLDKEDEENAILLSKLLEEEQSLEKEAEILRSMLGDFRDAQEGPDFQEILNQKEEQIQALLERLKRLQRDFENFKKRIEREKESIHQFANEKLLKAILPVLDNFERALEHARSSSDPKALEEGVKMIFRQFIETLEGFGLMKINAMGTGFDPNLHDAMVHIEDANHPPNTVISIYQDGYLLSERLIRPAKVVVSKGAESDIDKGDG